MNVNFKRILFYLWPQVKKSWLAFILIFVGYTVGIVFDSILKPYLFKELVDGFSSGLPKDVVLVSSMTTLVYLVVITIIHNIGYRTGDYATSHVESRVMKRLYDFSFNKLLQHSYNFFSNNFSGSLIAKTKRFTKSFETFFDILSFQIFFVLVTLVGILTMLFIQLPTMGWLFLAWAIIYIFVSILFIRYRIKYDLQEAEADSGVTGRLSDVIMNVFNVKIFSSTKFEKENFAEITKNEQIKRSKTWDLGNFQNMIQAVMMATLQILMVYFAIKLWYVDQLTVGTIILLQLYTFNLFDILWNLGRSMTKAVKALTDMQEIVDIFDTVPDILDPESPEELKIKYGKVSFTNVDFAYKNGLDVINNFSLEITPGEHIGLVGHSGAGKSTITKLLLRFADAQNGDITIDGQNIKNITQDDLRSAISYVPQEPILFHRTIKENISYSKPNATDEEIISVAKSAFAHDFIVKLPNGYDTLVGERGVKLSGGERQRVAIARAMLKDAPVLVLDEATSSLDSVSEDYIQRAFVKLMKNKTTIVIAHRLSTIQKMDRIVVIEDGSIAESGTHKELLDKDGIYAELWNHQTGGFIEE